MSYNFKTYAPFMQRGQNFPNDIVRIRRTSLVISANIMEQFSSVRFTNESEQERVPIIFKVDAGQKVIQLEPSKRGYVVQCRANGNGYLNTTRLKFDLPVGDYVLIEKLPKSVPNTFGLAV